MTIASTTTVTTTDAVGYACKAPSLVYPTLDCQHNLTAGSFCRARPLQTKCVAREEVVFSCPVDNPSHTEPSLAKGHFSIRCRVCGIASAAPNDFDERDGYISTELRFGPNALDGAVDEAEVLGYYLFMTDACGHKMGAAVASVQASSMPPSTAGTCCQPDVYKVTFTAQLPFNTSRMAIMVVPNTTGGLLPVGACTSPVVDRRPPVQAATSKGIVGKASRATTVLVSRWLMWMCMAVGVAKETHLVGLLPRV